MLGSERNLQFDYLFESWRHFKKLHTLKLRSFDQSGFEPLASCICSYNCCYNLKKLFIVEVELNNNNSTFRFPRKIETLKIVLKSSSSITGDITWSVSRLEELKDLHISGSYNSITDFGLNSICKLYKLESLDISCNSDITGSEFKRASFNNLKKLICSCCINLEDGGLIRLLKCAKNLEYLNISYCYKITNATIDAAITILKNRANNAILEIIIDATDININEIDENILSLHLIREDKGPGIISFESRLYKGIMCH